MAVRFHRIPYLNSYGSQPHRYRKPLTDEQKNELREKYLAGKTTRELATEYKITMCTVRRQLGHIYVPPVRKNPRKVREKKCRRPSRNFDKLFSDKPNAKGRTWDTERGWQK